LVGSRFGLRLHSGAVALLPCMIQTSGTRRRYGSRTAPVAPVALVAAWGIAWIASHTSPDAYAHVLFQTLALAESVIALLLRRRKPVGALIGILVAYFAFQLDPLLVPALLIALFTVATLTERRTTMLATAATAATVAALPLTGRASIDLAGYLLPRMLAVSTAAAAGRSTQGHTARRAT
jgi:FtsH-binding integral membrane protein